jgi:hypothetical protein
VPVGEQPDAPPPNGAPHVPFGAVPTFTQLPLQHSRFDAQISFDCVQNETPLEQTPPLQKFEQHSPFDPHGFPEVRHAEPGFTEPQIPPPVPSGLQIPLQQSVPFVHAPGVGLSATHCLSEHTLFTHEPVQHSVPAEHAAAGALHAVLGGAHVPAPPSPMSQLAVQHSRPLAHPWPTSLHVAASIEASFRIASMNASAELPSPLPLPSTFDPSCVVEPSTPPSVCPSSAPVSVPHPAKTVAVDAAPSNARAIQGSFLMSFSSNVNVVIAARERVDLRVYSPRDDCILRDSVTEDIRFSRSKSIFVGARH